MNRADLVADLRRLGIRAGDALRVHSSFKAIGPVEGGPQAVVAALMEAVTPRGLVSMPTHTTCFKGRPGAEPFYDPAKTASVTGIIPQTFWQTSGVLRSRHPTHSDAAWGEGAQALLEGHERAEPTGRGSPLDRFNDLGGWILLAGCGNNSNTSIHLAESLFGAPYMRSHYDEAWGREASYLGEDGRVRTIAMNEIPGCSCSFTKVTPVMDRRGLNVRGRLGNANCIMMRSPDLVLAVFDMLREDPGVFINDACPHCQIHRRAMGASPPAGRARGG